MASDEMAQFKEMFVSEAQEYLQSLNHGLLVLEKEPENKDSLNGIFRAAHTLKSMAGTMGFEKIVQLTQEMETLLDKLRKGELSATSEIVDVLFNCFDVLGVLMEDVITEKDSGLDLAPLVTQLRSLITETSLKPVTEAESQEPKEERNTDDEVPINCLEKDSLQPAESKSVPVFGEESKSAYNNARQESKRKNTRVRVSIEQLDNLMNLVGELVINKARLIEIVSRENIPQLSETLRQFDRISLNLQEEVLKTRMVPIAHVFDRYPRMIRDLARKENKEINFVVTGSEIEIDRVLLEEINDPLVHLLRNALDHGIEPTEERIKNGKTPVGVLKLEAKREKGCVRVDVIDDGKGLDAGRIRQRSVEKKLISES